MVLQTRSENRVTCSFAPFSMCRPVANWADLLQTLGRREDAQKWRSIVRSSRQVFSGCSGMSSSGCFAATTAAENTISGVRHLRYILVLQILEQSKAVASVFLRHTTRNCAVTGRRHLPAGVYWEQAGSRDSYQNGGFWATPTGWFVYTLDLVDPQLADQTVLEMVADFQKSGALVDLSRHHELPNYLASASLPQLVSVP